MAFPVLIIVVSTTISFFRVGWLSVNLDNPNAFKRFVFLGFGLTFILTYLTKGYLHTPYSNIAELVGGYISDNYWEKTWLVLLLHNLLIFFLSALPWGMVIFGYLIKIKKTKN